VRRRDLIRHLRANGCDLLREGGKHSVINDFLARKICRDLEIPEPLKMES